MRRTVIAVVLATVALAAAPAGAAGGPRPFGSETAPPGDTDIVRPVLDTRSMSTQAVGDEFDGDPLRLVVWPNDMRRHSLGTDQIGVYVCTWSGAPGGLSLTDVTATLNSAVNSFYDGLSGGAYNPTFVARDVLTVTANSFQGCANAMDVAAGAAGPAYGDAAAFGALDNEGNGGLGGPGLVCANCTNLASETFPDNQRWAVVDGGSVKAGSFPAHITTAAHEVGHTVNFPHSNSGETSNLYDNPIDYMSGNMTADFIRRADDPYSSLAFNRYRAGWVDPTDVVIYRGGVVDLTIAPVGVAGTQLVVLPTGYAYSFLALDARINSTLDPIPASFEGVSAHYIEQWCDPGSGAVPCAGLASRPYSYPPSPNSIDHVTAVGGTAVFNLDRGETLVAFGTKLKVIGQTVDGFAVRLIGFADIADSIFNPDIIWLAEQGITRGCTTTDYCPDKNVTRGQMAAFLVRALGLTNDGGGNTFTDDDGSVFEADIAKLAAAGITLGCDPPTNDRFCPGSRVTREQMAAFLERALG